MFTAWLYRPVIHAPFVYEDDNWVQGLEPGERFEWLGRRSVPSRWLTMETYRVQAVYGSGADPAGYHAVNVGLHLLCGVLVWSIAGRMGLSRRGSMLSAGIFLLHPIATQAVSYLSARSDLLMTLWILLAVLISLAWKARYALLPVLMCLFLAAISKEIGLVGGVLVMSVCFARHRFGMALALGALAFWGFAFGLPRIAEMLPAVSLTDWLTAMSVQVASLARIVGLFVVPVGLNFDPDPVAVPMGLRMVMLTGLVILAGVAWMSRQTAPMVWWAVCWVAIVLLPRVLVPNGEPIQDHHAYLALVGVSLGAGDGVFRLGERTYESVPRG